MDDEKYLTMKSKILKTVYQKGEAWDYELVELVMKWANRSGDYWKWLNRFWTIEMVASNLVSQVDMKMDDGTHFSKGKVLYKLRITRLGKEEAEQFLV